MEKQKIFYDFEVPKAYPSQTKVVICIQNSTKNIVGSQTQLTTVQYTNNPGKKLQRNKNNSTI